ncbi:SchA/CurD-like domain-containing protein [Streptomyces sp. NPDC048604]|uniref:SchA/CurD-like domain-containing protein n=1 Tax=Streptomyces sp. NPDC048604 TaxID=3365578 RepID=UPI00371758E2
MTGTTKAEGGTARLRVLLLCEVGEGRQQQFLDAYERVRHAVAEVPGHVVDQLCRSTDEPGQWLITSEWESAELFHAWVDSAEHLETVAPLRECVVGRRSLRYTVERETTGRPPSQRSAAEPGPEAEPAAVVTRHAITYAVRPGSGPDVAKVFGARVPPAGAVSRTRLRRASLYRHGDRFFRTVEITGGPEHIGPTLAAIVRRPHVRAIEEEVRHHMVADVDLGDEESARSFFRRAALRAVRHHAAGEPHGTLHRHVLFYPVLPGRGPELVELLGRHGASTVDGGAGALRTATVYAAEDMVLRSVDLAVPAVDAPGLAVGVGARPDDGAELAALLDPALCPYDLSARDGLRAYLDAFDMPAVTDFVATPA